MIETVLFSSLELLLAAELADTFSAKDLHQVFLLRSPDRGDNVGRVMHRIETMPRLGRLIG